MTWAPSVDVRLFVVLALALVGLLVLARRFAVASGARGLLLFLLRATSLGLIVMILLNPVRIETIRRPAPPPSVFFLFDGSRSMGLETPVTRSQAAQDLARRALVLVPPERLPKVQSFRFGRALSAVPDAGNLTLPWPDEDETRLVSILKELPSRFDDGLPAGVFVFSDGRVTESEGTERLAQFYRASGVPIHVIPMGDPQASGDVALRMIDAPRNAVPGTKVPCQGLTEELGIRWRTNRAEDPLGRKLPQGRPDRRITKVTLTGGEQSYELIVETDQARGPLVIGSFPPVRPPMRPSPPTT